MIRNFSLPGQWIKKRAMPVAIAVLALSCNIGTAMAQEATEAADAAASSAASSHWNFYLVWAVAFGASIAALVQAFVFYK